MTNTRKTSIGNFYPIFCRRGKYPLRDFPNF
uniref:Uncharacterized protein n=1 Tax=Myoviridae sp. ctXXl13 TaxID=2827691 RepID=A0A8S5TJB8_9CAUD|nr:MAG TPA: hypothetical protein [Myoviridae sp. ctXXl13]